MGIKTYFTLDYLERYLANHNIKVPEGCDLASIFAQHDKYDQNLNEVVDENGKTGDDRLQSIEVPNFMVEIYKFGSDLFNAVKNCKNEVFEKQKQELLESPPNSTEEFYQENSYEYVCAKLKQLGIEDIDTDKINDLLNQFDYDLDSDTDSFLTPEEASVNIRYENGVEFNAKTFLNKNKDNKYEKTHILDYIVNQYINMQKS